MKIIHCADLHLDSKMTANLSKDKARERKTELLATFTRMVEYAKEHHVEAILIAGDLYDTKNISATAKNTIRDAIRNYPEIEFYYLKGNHDAESFLADMTEIPSNLKMFGDVWTTYTLGTSGKITVSGVELHGENRGSIYHSLVLDAQQFNIVMLHGQEAEHKAKDKAEVISLRELKNKGIDYLALGHVHGYKKADLDSRGIYCYPGCLEGRGFDECGEHGFVLLEIDEEKGTMEHSFVPFACRNLYTLQVDVTDCLTSSEILQIVRKALEQEAYSERSMLKIVLTGSVDVECEKNPEFMVKQLEDGYYFLKIYDETELKVDYHAFAKDMSLKGEFVRLVQCAEDLTEEERNQIIRYGIQALTGKGEIE